MEGFLLTGDLETDGMAKLLKMESPTPVTLFKFPPHGSRNSLPLRWLKIDKSFVAHICESRDDRLLAGVIVEMGHQFGLRVIAEGVERTAQRDLLAAIGCDEIQGFLTGAPMAANAFWTER